VIMRGIVRAEVFGQQRLLIEQGLANLLHLMNNCPYEKFWLLCAYPGFGDHASAKMAAIPPTVNAVRDAHTVRLNSDLVAIISRNLSEILDLAKLMRLYYPVNAQVAERNVTMAPSIQVVITGGVPGYKSREIFADELRMRGLDVADRVTKATNYLICDDPASTSAKAKTARQLGIPIMTPAKFLTVLK
jgi:NAD-dependent DNA ligase